MIGRTLFLSLAVCTGGFNAAWAGDRVGVSASAWPGFGLFLGPDLALRKDLAGTGLHVDVVGLYFKGPNRALEDVLTQVVQGDESSCVSGLPGYISGHTTMDVRGVLGLGAVSMRAGISNEVSKGIPGKVGEYLIENCHVSMDGSVLSIASAPSIGIFVHAGPLEVTTDLLVRVGVFGSDPYKWGEEPEEAQWVRKGTDYIPTTAELPLRVAVEVGPVYVRGGLMVGVAFPSKNRKLGAEQYDWPEPLPALTGQLDMAVGLTF